MKRTAQITIEPQRTIADIRHELVSVGRCPECAMVVNREPSRAPWAKQPDDHLAEAVEEMGFILGREFGDPSLQSRRSEQTRVEVLHVLVHLFAWAFFAPETPRAEPARTIDERGQVSLWAGL